MKTGIAGSMDTSYIVDAGLDLLNKLMKFAVINGALYAKSAGRHNLSGTDIIYALQYEAHEFPYRNCQTPEEHESSDDEESDSEEECEDDDLFTRSTSNEDLIVKMNHYHDTWDSWTPDPGMQAVLKNAVDKAILAQV